MVYGVVCGVVGHVMCGVWCVAGGMRFVMVWYKELDVWCVVYCGVVCVVWRVRVVWCAM